MANKRSVSPGPVDLMPQILALVAEPVFNKKKPDKTCVKQPPKVINHDFCVVCCGGGEIICCDKCPNSYHINCHHPLINKLPEGEWFCRRCTTYPENEELSPEVPINDNMDKTERIMVLLGRELRAEFESAPFSIEDKFFEEIPIHRKHIDVKIPARKQLDKFKMIRKKERCSVCKRGILRGRLVSCNYCSGLYHLACLDPPNRYWDHKTKWMCPEHKSFFGSVYSEYFPSDYHGVLADVMAVNRFHCEIPRRPLNNFFNIPSQIDSLYKTPPDNIPAATNSSFKILCDVASFALASFNDNASNDSSAKILTYKDFKKSQKKYSLPPRLPPASLYCLSTSINTSIRKHSFSIGTSRKNDLCLSSHGNCEFISEYHATILYDERLGDYQLKNHSQYGFIVDGVSYFGKCKPPTDDSIDGEFNKVDYLVKKLINERTRKVRTRQMLCLKQDPYSDSIIVGYVEKPIPFSYKPLYKYYKNKFEKAVVPPSQKFKCKCRCSSRLFPKDGYGGLALLRNESMITIGCMRFKFTFGDPGVKKVASKVGKKKKKKSKRDSTGKKSKHLNGTTRLKSRSERENGIGTLRRTRNELPSVTMNGGGGGGLLSIEDEEMDCAYLFNEQNHTETINLAGSEDLSDRGALSNDDRHQKDSSITLISDDEPLLDFNLSSLPDVRQFNGLLSDKVQTVVTANDLIQELEVVASDCEEEYVYGTMNYAGDDDDDNSATADHIANVQNWIIEEEVVVDEDEDGPYDSGEPGNSVANHSAAPAVEYLVPSNNQGDFKTEHLYCARDPREPRDPRLDEPIVISDDDD